MAPEVDRAVLDKLADDLGRDYVRELYALFLAEVPPKVAAASAAAGAGDAEGVALAVHSLRSAGALVGAQTAIDLCTDLERDARAGDLTEAAGRVAEISGHLAGAAAELEDFLATGRPRR